MQYPLELLGRNWFAPFHCNCQRQPIMTLSPSALLLVYFFNFDNFWPLGTGWTSTATWISPRNVNVGIRAFKNGFLTPWITNERTGLRNRNRIDFWRRLTLLLVAWKNGRLKQSNGHEPSHNRPEIIKNANGKKQQRPAGVEPTALAAAAAGGRRPLRPLRPLRPNWWIIDIISDGNLHDVILGQGVEAESRDSG